MKAWIAFVGLGVILGFASDARDLAQWIGDIFTVRGTQAVQPQPSSSTSAPTGTSVSLPASSPQVSTTTPAAPVGQSQISTPLPSVQPQSRQVQEKPRILTPVRAPIQVVDRCLRVEGVGAAREAAELRVGVRTFKPTTLWVKRVTQPVQNQTYDWFAGPVYVGAERDFGKYFDVLLFEVPIDKLAKYDDPDPDKFYTEDQLKADGVVVVDSVRVQRSNGPDSSCR